LGVSPSQVDSSTATIKDLDLERTLTMLKRKENSQKNLDEGDSSFVITEASSLCDDLIESAPVELHTHKEESARGGRVRLYLGELKKEVGHHGG
jgi:hypothetical protein